MKSEKHKTTKSATTRKSKPMIQPYGETRCRNLIWMNECLRCFDGLLLLLLWLYMMEWFAATTVDTKRHTRMLHAGVALNSVRYFRIVCMFVFAERTWKNGVWSFACIIIYIFYRIYYVLIRFVRTNERTNAQLLVRLLRPPTSRHFHRVFSSRQKISSRRHEDEITMECNFVCLVYVVYV